MAKSTFYTRLDNEIKRIDAAQTAKRQENIIERYAFEPSPRAIIAGKKYHIFNSNDYLGLRFDKQVREAEHAASELYGAGPGSVRFISGTMKVYDDLEKKLAAFHKREAAMIFSSAFATNIAVLFCLAKGQSKDSLIGGETLVISDALNHRSIIDGIRIAGLSSEQKAIFKHLDYDDLARILEEQKGKFKRVLVVSDGIFSMLGEQADLAKLTSVVNAYDEVYEEGVLSIIDDSHGVGVYGKTGRGCEEIATTTSDLLVGTLGKAFGTDGGYVVGDRMVIDYLRESAATYIYSNPISPSVAGAALAAVNIVDSEKGRQLLAAITNNIQYFKQAIQQTELQLAADSQHPIQPLLIGDPAKTQQLRKQLFEKNILVTNINYPVVPMGKDEIRIQLSATHTREDLTYLIDTCSQLAK